VLVAGPLADTLTDASLSDCFAAPVRLDGDDGRWTARIARS
jgi:hypothetical protein